MTLKRRISTAGVWAETVASFSLMKRSCSFTQTCSVLSPGDASSAHRAEPCLSAGGPLRAALAVTGFEKERSVRAPPDLTGLTPLACAACQGGSAGSAHPCGHSETQRSGGRTGAQLGGALVSSSRRPCLPARRPGGADIGA